MNNALVSTLRSGVLAIPLLVLAGCGGSADTSPTADTFVPPSNEWTLVFADEFDGTSLDRGKWNVQTGDGCAEGICGWGNNEQQIYTDNNFRVENGSLIIEARSETDGTLTSARLNSADKMDILYGRVEVRAKLPTGLGTWPAIWMLPTDSVYGTWPLSGEIDIMEAINLGTFGAPNRVFSTTHYGLPFPQNTFVSESYDDFSVLPQDDFHVYEVEWQAGQLRFYVDGVHYHSQNSDNWYTYGRDANGVASVIGGDAPFDQRFHVLLNLAIGGNLPGLDVDLTALPAQFEIDYVRMYQCDSAEPETGRGCGRASADVEIKDAPDAPYTEGLSILSDGAPVLSLTSADTSVATNTLIAGGTGFDGATVTENDVNAFDGGNAAWKVGVSGGLGEVYLRSEDLTDNPVLETGFDLSGSEDAGQLVFDMKVNSIQPGTTFSVGLRSNASSFALIPLDPMPTAPGAGYTTYAIDIGRLVNAATAARNGTEPLDLENILDIFLMQINGTADVFIDNIRISTACREVGDCTATLNFKSLPFDVFTDEIAPIWDRGIGAADNTDGFVDYFDGDSVGRKVNWEIRPADDPDRGNIIDVTFTDKDDFAVWFIQTTDSIPLNGYATGSVVFDINVLDYGQNEAGMTMKIDCIFPCTSGDQSIGRVGENGWEEVRVPVAQLINSGLSLATVNTGLVLFPTDQVGEINFLVDNIRWEPPITRLDVFLDIVSPTWGGGIGAADSGTDFATYRDGNIQGAKVNWQTITDGDPLRSQVIEVTFNDSAENGVWFIDDLDGVDISSFERGELVFGLNVTDYGSNTSGMVVKVDCFFPCTSGEIPLGRVADGQWEEIRIPVADLVAGGLDVTNVNAGIVLFPTTGDQGDVTFRVDAVRYEVDEDDAGPPLLTPPVLPITFEDETVDYSFIDFEGTFTLLVDDPERAGNTVARTDRGAGSASFAGTVIGRGQGLGENIEFDLNTTQMTLEVYSPAAGIPVRIKVENFENSSESVETEVLTTVANQWETLTFDFNDEVPNTPALDLDGTYNQVIIFFNFGSTTAPDQTFYWDNLALGGGGFTPLEQIDLPVTFDDPDVNYSVIDFEGTFTTIGNDPDNAENSVAVTIRGDGSATFAGTVIGTDDGFANPIPFTATEQIVSMRVYAPAAGIPVRLKVENTANNGLFAEAQVNTTVGDAWETLLFDFSQPVVGEIRPGVEYDKAIVFFNFDTPGAVAGEQVFRWDDLAFGEPPPPPDLTAPTLTTVSLASSNGNPALATSGDTLSLTIVADEPIAQPTVSFGGVPADAVSGADMMWTATRTLPGTTPDGAIAITVDAVDLAGNAAARVAMTTDGSGVTFDGTAPGVAINGAPVAVDTNDPIVLDIVFTEAVTGFDAGDVVVTNASNDGVTTTDNTTFELTITPDGSETDITVTLAADVATDAAGNPNTAATDVSIQYGFTPTYVETFADDFDGAMLDTNTWNIDTGDGCPDNCGFGNGELQSYAAANVSVDGGVLRLEARDEGGMTYTSGRVNTRGTVDLRYGRVEVVARMPEGTGTWPSVTLVPTDNVYGAYPASGEITLTQARNLGTGGETDVYPQLEFGLPAPETSAIGQAVTPDMPAATEFNTYAIEWEDGEIRWFINGTHVQTQTSNGWYVYAPNADGVNEVVAGSAPFDQTFHVALGFAIGGTFPGAPDMTTTLPQVFEIDSVRVFTCENGEPGTGRGCGSGDPAVTPISAPSAPYTETISVFADAPGVNTIDIDGQTGSNTIVPGTLADDMATVTADPAVLDGTNTFWQAQVAGGTGGIRADSENLDSDILLVSGFDLTGADVAGQLLFDLRVNSADPAAVLNVDMRTDDNDLARAVVDVPTGDWQTVAVNIVDLVMSMDSVGGGIALDKVLTPFALEASGGDAAFDVDNIRVVSACREAGNCRARPRVRNEVGTEPLVVYDNGITGDEWQPGIGASNTPDFVDYFEGDTANVFNWTFVNEAGRGDVIQITTNDIGETGVWFVKADAPVDLSRYAGGILRFDLRVLNYGNNTEGFTMKVDCVFPCTSGEVPLDALPVDTWETIEISVPRLVSGGLDLTNVNTGLVLFPTGDATQYSGGLTYQVDNIRWVAGPFELPIDFDTVGVDYSFSDADGQSTTRALDPNDSNNAVARTERADSALTTASTTITLGSAIPFNVVQTSISVDVQSPMNGLPVRLRLGNSADANVAVDVEVSTTVADAFETLVFDFAAPAPGSNALDLNTTYDTLTLLFNAGVDGATAGAQVWYWDNVTFLPVPGLTIFDDFEDGDVTNWSFFDNGVDAGGGGGVRGDASTPEGNVYFHTGWGGQGTTSGFYGGAVRNLNNNEQLEIPAEDPYLNLWIRHLNLDIAMIDGYTLEITLREDTNGDGWSTGLEDSIVYEIPFVQAEFDDVWRFYSIPLTDFTDALTGGNGTFDGLLDELVLGIGQTQGPAGTAVEPDFDYIHFTSGAPPPPTSRPDETR